MYYTRDSKFRIGDSRLPQLESLEGLYLCLVTMVYACASHWVELQVPIPNRADPLEGIELVSGRHDSLVLGPRGGCHFAAIRK